MEPRKHVVYRDDAADAEYFGQTIGLSIVTAVTMALFPPAGIALAGLMAARTIKSNREFENGTGRLSHGASTLDTMTSESDDALAAEFNLNRSQGEDYLSVNHSAYIPRDPSVAPGLFTLPGGEVKKTTYYSFKDVTPGEHLPSLRRPLDTLPKSSDRAVEFLDTFPKLSDATIDDLITQYRNSHRGDSHE